jgi:hypothetical protein
MLHHLAAVLLPVLFLTPGGGTHPTSPTHACATCIGADPCHACSDCSECRNCNDLGGTCGICHQPLRTISGHIILPGIVNAAQPLTFAFASTDGLVSFTRTVTLSAAGDFQITGVNRKDYAVHIKGAKWLARNITVHASAADVSDANATLLPGDVNGDNEINIIDLGPLADAFNTTPVSPKWNANADLNCDGKVNILDLGLLADNFGKSGDP